MRTEGGIVVDIVMVVMAVMIVEDIGCEDCREGNNDAMESVNRKVQNGMRVI